MTPTVELSLSGCHGQPCGGESVVDVVLDGCQCGAQHWRGLGLPGGEQRGKDAVVDLGMEDGEGQPVSGEVMAMPEIRVGATIRLRAIVVSRSPGIRHRLYCEVGECIVGLPIRNSDPITPFHPYCSCCCHWVPAVAVLRAG